MGFMARIQIFKKYDLMLPNRNDKTGKSRAIMMLSV